MNKRADAFSDCHPAVNFLYFAAVILVSMFLSHPVYLILSFAGALSYSVRLKGAKKQLKSTLMFILPMMLVVSLLNPLFNHYGVTVLFYLESGPVTLEALVYGFVLSSMLFISILWFGCVNVVMTTDKFVYLFGKVMPAISLILSMVFRFVPKFTNQTKIIRQGQKCVGRDLSNGSFLKKAKYGIKILSILITWALENAIETSDSMKARGYGLKGRSSFSIFRFDKRDGIVSAILIGLAVAFSILASSGATAASYDPMIRIEGIPLTPESSCAFLLWGVFTFFPVLMGLQEDLVFRRLQTKANHSRHDIWYIAKETRT